MGAELLPKTSMVMGQEKTTEPIRVQTHVGAVPTYPRTVTLVLEASARSQLHLVLIYVKGRCHK